MVEIQNFQDTFEKCKRSCICAFSICITVPLIITWLKRCSKNFWKCNKNKIHFNKLRVVIEKTLLKCRILSHVWQQKYKSGNAPVKDNCYITIYRGFTHEECSLNYKIETPKVFVEQNDNCNSKNTVSFPI